MKKLIMVVTSAFFVLTAFSACKKTQPANNPPVKTNKEQKQPKAPVTRKTAETPTPAPKQIKDWVLKGYEEMRLALAADKFDATKKGAAALIQGSKATKDHKKLFTALAQAAEKVQKAKDIEAARVIFGDVSKQVIAYALQTKQTKGITCYMCPMAKGYKKWIQLDSNMANPYMGTRMLKCGAKTKLSL